MTVEPPPVEPIPTEGGVDVLDKLVIAEVSSLLEGDLAELAATDTVDQAITDAQRIRAELGVRLNPIQLPIGENILDTLTNAYRTGEVLPNQTIEAMQYAFTSAGPLIVRPDGIHGHTLAGEFNRYAAHVHNHVHAPTKLSGAKIHPGAGHLAPSVNIGVRVPEPNTPGGKIVTQAEARIETARITVPGLSPVEARGISLAIARAYEDTLTVLVGSLNHVEAQITALGRTVAIQGHQGTTALSQIASTVPSVTHTLGELKRDQATLQKEIRHVETLIHGLQAQITSIRSQPPTTTPAPAPIGTPALSPSDRALVGSIPLLATTASVTKVSLVANRAEALALKNRSVLGDSYVPNLPSRIQTLEECCAANSGVTNPIRSGGASPSLLGSLGGLLAKGAELLVGAAIVETVIALFDMPDVILGEMRSMQWVRPIAEAAARGALADTQWSKQLNPGIE